MSTQPRTVTTRRPHVQINVNAPPEAGTQHGASVSIERSLQWECEAE